MPKVQSLPPAPPSYAPPADPSSLRFGDAGPKVKDLQHLLNQLGAQPPLKEDGLFGPKTQAALKGLLGTNVFDASAAQQAGPPPAPAATPPAGDAFSPPAAPALPSAASQPVDPTVAAQQVNNTPAAGSLADRVTQQALSENDSINPMKRGDDGHYKGWQKLQQVFQETTGWKPSDAECQKIEPGKGVQPGGKSWCGIWACHVFQEAGVNVKWDLTKGEMVGDVTHQLAPKFSNPAQYKAERAAFEASIKPGDCITLPGNNHHAIVTQVNSDGTVDTMDGNKPYVGPGHQKLSNVTSYYRPNGA